MQIDVPSQVVDVSHKRPPLKALTSIRFFAAIYVVLFHLQIGFNVAGASWLSNFMKSGYTGVTLFFVLSGFILAYNYPQVSSRNHFWIARFARIYPAYALSLLLSLSRPLNWNRPHMFVVTALAFGLLQAYWIPFSSSINPAAWTLSVEAFFYALFPFLLPRLRKLRRRSFWLIQAAYLLFLCVPIALTAMHRMDSATWLSNLIESPFPLFRLNTFVVGAFMGIRFHATSHEEKQNRTYKWQVLGGVIFSVVLLCLSLPTFLLPLRTFLLTYSFMLLIFGLTRVEWRGLTNHWMQVAGEISYGIYILQFPVILACSKTYRLALHGQAPFWLEISFLVAVAYVSFRWIEIPARLTIRRLLTGQPVQTRLV